MMFEMIVDSVAYICGFIACLSHHEFVFALLSSASTGVIAFGLYFLTKRSERQDNRYNTARILHNELSRILKTKNSKTSKPTARKQLTMNIYRGLLATGDIKHLSDDMQDDLSEFYIAYEPFGRVTDMVLGLEITKKLEKIKHDNRGYLHRNSKN